MKYQQAIFGAGMHTGIAMERNRIVAMFRAAEAQAKAQSRQNMRDAGAKILASVITGLVITAIDIRKQRLQERRSGIA